MSSDPGFSRRPEFDEMVQAIEVTPRREARYAEGFPALPPRLAEKCRELGIERLYSHQAQAVEAGLAGRDLVVVTGTNSGKTLCYALRAMQLSLAEPAARCLMLFPTKALARDQAGRLESLKPSPHVRIGVYDGDTPKSHRSAIRNEAQIVLSNPDMLHLGVLPSHDHWSRFLKSLRLIVLDECHVYRGVFGSNVANVLRRLLRLCAWHHAHPQIIACSATIANPEEHFQNLTGRPPLLIDDDGSPQGQRTYVILNPPEGPDGKRLSANIATSESLAMLAETGVRSLAFNRARVSAELVLKYTRDRLKRTDESLAKLVESYRAGYTPIERRQIEQRLFKGELRALSATSAMELGVDVGGLDAVILNGYPGTAGSFWQQVGRAGRGERDGLAVFVAHDDALEQYLARHPDVLLRSKSEPVATNPENRRILGRHLLCAAHERPLSLTELEGFGPSALDAAEELDRSGELQFSAGMFFYPSFDPPAPKVNIRGSTGDEVKLMLAGETLGTMEYGRALTHAHEGAVYLHRGQSFLVRALDLLAREATLTPHEADYYTLAQVQSVLQTVMELGRKPLPTGDAVLSTANVTELVEGYQKRSLDGERVLDALPLELPPLEYDTIAVRIDLPALPFDLEVEAMMGGIHGAEHALIAMAPLIAGCDRLDLGSAWYTVFAETLRPAVFVYDKAPGGVGLVDRLYERTDAWIEAALRLVADCPCESGCPGCLLSGRCECGNEPIHKAQTLVLLRALSDGR